MLFSEPKIPQSNASTDPDARPPRVSVLFSEPKIPQSWFCKPRRLRYDWFQCSSASRKFLNKFMLRRQCTREYSFSALQRAENSSIAKTSFPRCSTGGFSALQRAENSSMVERDGGTLSDARTFQCSSASRKFLNHRQLPVHLVRRSVSVLFSEPKIPQSARAGCGRVQSGSFSALQRAENSSIPVLAPASAPPSRFQCSSASRKFLNDLRRAPRQARGRGFSALQRAENSSILSDCFSLNLT